MNEEILVKSKVSKKWKYILLTCIFGFLALALLCLLIATSNSTCGPSDPHYRYCDGFIDHFDDLNVIIPLSINWGFIIFSLIVAIMYWALCKCSLTVTDKNVRGKTLFGKEVVIPLHMVSAYSTRSFLSTICVASSSGLTKFSLIENVREIGETLSKLINERQQNTETAIASQAPSAPTSSNLDELKKLKELLDSGIISQEEFDKKKAQLLGL